MKTWKDNTKYLMYFLATILVDGGFFLLADYVVIPTIISIGAITGVRLFWYYIIIKESSLYRTIYWRLLCFAIVILLIGALAKLEHWWFASYFLIIGLLAAALIYFFRFLFKRQKKLLDFVKVVFFELSLFIALAKLEHYSIDNYEYAQLGIFYVMIFLFSIKSDKRRRPMLMNDAIYRDEIFSFEEADSKTS